MTTTRRSRCQQRSALPGYAQQCRRGAASWAIANSLGVHHRGGPRALTACNPPSSKAMRQPMHCSFVSADFSRSRGATRRPSLRWQRHGRLPERPGITSAGRQPHARCGRPRPSFRCAGRSLDPCLPEYRARSRLPFNRNVTRGVGLLRYSCIENYVRRYSTLIASLDILDARVAAPRLSRRLMNWLSRGIQHHYCPMVGGWWWYGEFSLR